ncbi:NmrA family NAD(P)-binding protein [Streptomyces sp. NPDC050548]|uniref:NmrA family NAD(P)-binding protein n=1 Tax=Streptomyces sp. NPDC050548 TaxID=3365629 RepID=UPI0037B10D91
MILVTGATGNIGRALARELDARDEKSRLLVRDPARARAAGLPPSDRAELAVGDFGNPDTLTPALTGVDKLFLLTQGIGTEHTTAAVAAARAAGVRHIVHLSSAHVLLDPVPAMGRWHHERERIIRAAGIPATFLRPGGFMTNALDWLPTIHAGDYVLDPVGPGRYAPIDPADIAAVAADVLTGHAEEDEEYVLTGDETFTVAEQVRIISAAIGRTIEVRATTTPDEIVRFRFPHGAPPALAAAVTEGFALMRADTVGLRTDTVRRLLGRRPRTFADWCARHADAFRRPAGA